MKYLVYLTPSQDFTEAVMRYRESIKDYITDISSNELHCSLMALRIDTDDEENALHSLEGLSIQRFPITAGSLDLYAENTLVAALHKSGSLQELHLSVIEALRGFISQKEGVYAFPQEFTGDKQREEMYSRYGSPYFGPFYNPHVSIAQINPEAFSSLDKNSFDGLSWEADAFYISKKEAGMWKLVREYPLR